MNRAEVEEALIEAQKTADVRPNLLVAAKVLTRLVNWTDANSDGWVYWPKPSNAASKLQQHLERVLFLRRFGLKHDIDLTDEELKAAVRPIKSFITRQINAGNMKYWAREQILGEAL